MNEGIDAVIVDSVLAIRKGLTEDTTNGAANGGTIVAISPMVSSDGESVTSRESSEREVVETVNGVPIYADGGLRSSTGAVFA